VIEVWTCPEDDGRLFCEIAGTDEPVI